MDKPLAGYVQGWGDVIVTTGHRFRNHVSANGGSLRGNSGEVAGDRLIGDKEVFGPHASCKVPSLQVGLLRADAFWNWMDGHRFALVVLVVATSSQRNSPGGMERDRYLTMSWLGSSGAILSNAAIIVTQLLLCSLVGHHSLFFVCRQSSLPLLCM